MAGENMVMVACKHPNGVILNLDSYVVTNKESNRIRRVAGPRTVTLKGWAHPFNKPDPAEETGGYVLTQVPADFWDEWVKQHADFPMLLDKTILGPHKDAQGQAQGNAAVPQMNARSDGTLRGMNGKPIAEALAS